MGELSRLTHKLALSIDAANARLARFYAYEAIESLREIKREVPFYDGQPIAVYLDHIAFPPLERLASFLETDATAADEEAARAMLGSVIESCNECHRATLHEFIRIKPDLDSNPFNQDFAP